LSDQLLGGLAVAGSQLVTFGQLGNDGGVYGVDNNRTIAPGCEKPGPTRRSTAIDVEANIQVTIAKSTDKFQHRIDILIGGLDRFSLRHLLFESCVQPVAEFRIQRVDGTGVALENYASCRL
jgi:hypothetical protein